MQRLNGTAAAGALTPASAGVTNNSADLMAKDQQSQDTAIAKYEAFIKVATARRAIIKRVIDELMKDGVHYGTIPGSDRPSLKQPGADLLIDVFQLRITYTIEVAIEDFDGAEHGGVPFFYYRIRGTATNANGDFVAEGLGSCHLWESKYKWRKGERVCPACQKPNIRKSSAERGGGWYCWRKTDGCGAEFAANDPAITSQHVDRVINPDLLDNTNAVLKIAVKRCKIGTVINATGVSDEFTQDVDEEQPEDTDTTPLPKAATTAQASAPTATAARLADFPDAPTRGDIRRLFDAAREAVGETRFLFVLNRAGIRGVDGIKTVEQARDLYRQLAQMVEGRAA